MLPVLIPVSNISAGYIWVTRWRNSIPQVTNELARMNTIKHSPTAFIHWSFFFTLFYSVQSLCEGNCHFRIGSAVRHVEWNLFDFKLPHIIQRYSKLRPLIKLNLLMTYRSLGNYLECSWMWKACQVTHKQKEYLLTVVFCFAVEPLFQISGKKLH